MGKQYKITLFFHVLLGAAGPERVLRMLTVLFLCSFRNLSYKFTFDTGSGEKTQQTNPHMFSDAGALLVCRKRNAGNRRRKSEAFSSAFGVGMVLTASMASCTLILSIGLEI